LGALINYQLTTEYSKKL